MKQKDKIPPLGEYEEFNGIKIDLNNLRLMIVLLMRDGFTEIGLGDLLWHIKSSQKEKA